jgi:hypothetical protein
VQPRAGLQDIADEKPDQQRNGRDDLEIDKRAQPDDADAAHIAHGSDPHDNGREYDDRDDGANEADETVP